MKTELKCTGELERRVMEYDGARKCFKCGAIWGAVPRPDPKTHVTNMPQEPQSETPRTDACQGTDGTIAACEEICLLARTLERELNEANKALNNFVLDNIANGKVRANLFIEQERLQQELSQVRGELERGKESLVAERLSAGELAKQNHKLREALRTLIPYASQYVSHPRRNPDDNWQLRMDEASQALIQPNPSSLTVLSRAEVENLPCNCKKEQGVGGAWGGDVKTSPAIKCIRCTLLERFTK